MLVNIDQIAKYNTPGPRYTSYPPAVHFAPDLTESEVMREIIRQRNSQRPLSLYFHLPFCQTLCWYCGCNTVITKNQSASARYVEALIKEIDHAAGLCGTKRTVQQIHFGGGTPTFLLPAELRELGDAIRRNFRLAPGVEASVEIDPRRLTCDHIDALRSAGMNRVSIGVQDFSPVVQQAINRIQSFEQTAEVIRWVREAGFQSVSIDLIYGLPHQSVESFSSTLDRVMSLEPDRLAVFSYAHVPWMKPSQKLLERASLPSAELKFAILKLTVERLTAEGYVYIGMDHFARPTDELVRAQQAGSLQRNFQGYSTHAGADILGFGMSSVSQTEDYYWQNTKDLDEYYAAVSGGTLPVASGYPMTAEDKLRRRVIMQIMCNLGLDYDAVSLELGIDFRDRFASEIASLADLEADGLLAITPGGIKVLECGRLLVRNIAMRFDPYMRVQRENTYSRTI